MIDFHRLKPDNFLSGLKIVKEYIYYKVCILETAKETRVMDFQNDSNSKGSYRVRDKDLLPLWAKF